MSSRESRKLDPAVQQYEAQAQDERNARLVESRTQYFKLMKAFRKGRAAIISILDNGALGDGVHDDKEALLSAMAAAQKLANATPNLRVVVHLPIGHTFFISPVFLQAASSVELRIDGDIVAPEMKSFPKPPSLDGELPSGWTEASSFLSHKQRETTNASSMVMTPELQRMQYSYIEVAHAHGLRITGTGTIYGNGRPWWRMRKLDPKQRAPVLVLIRDSENVAVTHVELRNSPFYHVVVLRSRRVQLRRLNISTPWLSVNTDGIDILASSQVEVRDCWVSTGDDNIAVKERSSYVTVRGGTFYRGHGLSIGSLGEGGTTASVTNVVLADVSFVRTTNAARVKTWQGGRGSVSNITFTNISVAAVGIPIVIDQFYCPTTQHPEPCANSTSAVVIRDVTINDIRSPRSVSSLVTIIKSSSSLCRTA